jgi:protein SCO1
VRAILLLAFFVSSSSLALTNEALKQIRFDQHPGEAISRDLVFLDSNGQQVKSGNLFDGRRPVIVVLGYFRCPMLCTLVNDGLIKSLQEMRWTVGREFNVADVSIDPNETPARARMRKAEYLKQYGRAGAAAGWQFLVGDNHSVAQLADECGFHYAYDKESGEYAHPSGLVILTPNGTISRYLLGVNFDATELLEALKEAGKGKKGSITHELALLCFHYNPITGKYSLAILKTLRLASVIMLIGGVAVLIHLARRSAARARV